MTNTIFADLNATVVELALKPHVDRCFGYIAMALGLDYWLVPQLSSFYYGNYTATQENVDAVIRLVRHVLKAKGVLISKAEHEKLQWTLSKEAFDAENNGEKGKRTPAERNTKSIPRDGTRDYNPLPFKSSGTSALRTIYPFAFSGKYPSVYQVGDQTLFADRHVIVTSNRRSRILRMQKSILSVS